MVGVRYKDLITALFFVATATWLWAEPSQQVKVPTSQTTTSQSFYFSDSPEASESPRALAVSDFEAKDFALDVAVNPGQDFASTTFDVTFRGPEGFDLVKDAGFGPEANFSVEFEPRDSDGYSAKNLQRLGPNRWRFRGADLQQWDGSPKATPLPVKGEDLTLVVITSMRDGEQSRYSRGANFVMLESEPVKLSLR